MRVKRIARSRTFGVLMLAILVMSAINMVSVHQADAQTQPVVVRITIERVTALSDVEGPGCGEADFYAKSWIDGDFRGDSPVVADDDDIFPDWEFSKIVDLAAGSVTARLEIWEDDWVGLCLGDDQIDISPDPSDMGLDFVINFQPCAVDAGITDGTFDVLCGATLRTEGDSGDPAAIEFRVDVMEPVSAENLRIRCIHDPIWPQPGGLLGITAMVEDASGQSLQADTVEIWFNDTTRPAVTDSGVTGVSLSGLVATGSTFSYACRAVVDGIAVWTGWRVVTIGESADDKAVPVLFTGPRDSRIDIVFVADAEDYGSSNSLFFQTHVVSAINNIFSHDLFLKNQDMFNFWIALGTGDADDGSWGCWHDAPDISWKDVALVLHTGPSDFRDCADVFDREISATMNKGDVPAHELGHVPFGLSDEYSGRTWHFQAGTFPNVYMHPVFCEADAPSLGRTADDCRVIIQDIPWWPDRPWWTSEPDEDDLMLDNGQPRAADIRRIEWIFDLCRGGNCAEPERH